MIHGSGLFLFASEIKAILEAKALDPVLDPVAMHHYLSLRYVPVPRTMFAGISKLPAAHTLTLEADRLKLHRYWELRYAPKLKISNMNPGKLGL